MGPFVLLRERSAGVQEWSEGLRHVAEEGGRTSRRVSRAALLAVGPALALLSSPTARHWLVELVANITVLGGFVGAPVLTVAAWVGLVLPERVPLHRISSTLFVVSLLWVCAAVVMAHVHERKLQGDRD